MRALVPEDLTRNGRSNAAKLITRAAFASARSATDDLHGRGPEEVARALWSTDMATPLLLKAASSPATTTTSAWAGTLAGQAVGDFVSSLAPLSAAAKLFDAALRVSLDGVNSIAFPVRSGAIDPTDVPWIPQGSALPVWQGTLSSVTLGPTHRLGIVVAMTRETAEHGAGEAVLTALLREAAALALDASLFSATAGTTDRPPGLLNGIAALTPATAGDGAMDADLADLAAAISGATTALAFVAHPAQAHAIRLRRGSIFPSDVSVWPTLGVSAGTVIALDPAAVVSAFGAEPEIMAAQEAVLHMEDTAPAAIGTPGSPNTVAAPTRSLWQTDCIAVRLILRAAWALRVPNSVAWMSGVMW